jgi:hypothetical protein
MYALHSNRNWHRACRSGQLVDIAISVTLAAMVVSWVVILHY